MHVFIVYCHPSPQSFTRQVLDSFIAGLDDAGHSHELSDLYTMDFCSDMSESEYLRDGFYREDLPLSPDVQEEQVKIQRADALVFIFPVFWTDAPAKMIGWFDRVWSYGFAYGDRAMQTLDRALFLCTTGHTLQNLTEYGHLDALRTILLRDRIHDRTRQADLVIFDGMSRHDMPLREKNLPLHLHKAYTLGLLLNDPTMVLK